MGRGALSDEIKKYSKEKLGYEIYVKELRLIPYVHYCLTNSRNLEVRQINEEERLIWQQWKEKGYVKGGATRINVTKKFWEFMNEILWLGYVNYDNEVEIEA